MVWSAGHPGLPMRASASGATRRLSGRREPADHHWGQRQLPDPSLLDEFPIRYLRPEQPDFVGGDRRGIAPARDAALPHQLVHLILLWHTARGRVGQDRTAKRAERQGGHAPRFAYPGGGDRVLGGGPLLVVPPPTVSMRRGLHGARVRSRSVAAAVSGCWRARGEAAVGMPPTLVRVM